LKNRITVAFISALIISIIYLISEYSLNEMVKEFSFSSLLILAGYTLLFFIIYFVVVSPLQVLIEKYFKKRYSLSSLALLLLFSFIVHFALYNVFNSHTPFYKNLEVIVSIFLTSIVYWFVHSLLRKELPY
jgi:drug/metabolite transporter (DMT)-like permease